MLPPFIFVFQEPFYSTGRRYSYVCVVSQGAYSVVDAAIFKARSFSLIQGFHRGSTAEPTLLCYSAATTSIPRVGVQGIVRLFFVFFLPYPPHPPFSGDASF